LAEIVRLVPADVCVGVGTVMDCDVAIIPEIAALGEEWCVCVCMCVCACVCVCVCVLLLLLLLLHGFLTKGGDTSYAAYHNMITGNSSLLASANCWWRLRTQGRSLLCRPLTPPGSSRRAMTLAY